MAIKASLIRIGFGIALVAAALSLRISGAVFTFPLNILALGFTFVGLPVALIGATELAVQLSPSFRRYNDKWARHAVEALGRDKRRRQRRKK